MKERTMTGNVTPFPNPDEVIDADDREYDAGVTHAEEFLQGLSDSLEGKSEMFCSAVWDVIFDVFDDGE